jgi:hypothetical protein
MSQMVRDSDAGNLLPPGGHKGGGTAPQGVMGT